MVLGVVGGHFLKLEGQIGHLRVLVTCLINSGSDCTFLCVSLPTCVLFAGGLMLCFSVPRGPSMSKQIDILKTLILLMLIILFLL